MGEINKFDMPGRVRTKTFTDDIKCNDGVIKL